MLLEYYLVAGNAFMFNVAATNSYGDSVFSLKSNPQLVYDKPDAPANLVDYPRESNENSIYMTWQNGPSDGNRPIIGYKVNVYTDANLLSLLKVVPSTDRNLRIEGLTKG